MKDYTILPNDVSKHFSPNDIYTIIGLYFTAHSDYTTDATYKQLQSLTGQSEDYIKKGFVKRLIKSNFCNIESYFDLKDKITRRNKYTLPAPKNNFRIIQSEIFEDNNLTSEEKGFIIALYCNCVNDTFNIGLLPKDIVSKLKISKASFYMLRSSLIKKGYMSKIKHMPVFIRSEDFPDDYMLTCDWLGYESYKDWILKNQYED